MQELNIRMHGCKGTHRYPRDASMYRLTHLDVNKIRDDDIQWMKTITMVKAVEQNKDKFRIRKPYGMKLLADKILISV